MRRSFFVSLVVMAVLLVVLACNNPGRGIQGAGDASTQGVGPNEIQIHFIGSIAHVFGKQENFVDRAVIMKARRDPPHKDEPHYFKITLPDSVDIAALAKATGAKPYLRPAYKIVEVRPVKAVTIRLIGRTGSTQEFLSGGVLDTAGSNFVNRVPSLKRASGDTFTTTALDTARVFGNVPDGKDYAAFFELDGGSFDANAYCKKTGWTNDYFSDGDRPFAKWVFLTGTLTSPPILQFTDATNTITEVTFTNPTYPLKIEIENLPDPSSTPMSHFAMFKRLSTEPPPAGLKWNDVKPVECPDMGPIPGCSNTQWP
jgi:hypothetical protein